MRRFLAVLLVCGLVWLGYEIVSRRGGKPVQAGPRDASVANKNAEDGQEPLEVVIAPAGRAQDLGSRSSRGEDLVGGLLGSGFAELDVEPAETASLELGTAGRYALEVALALKPECKSLVGLTGAAAALAARDPGKDCVRCLEAGALRLAKAGRPIQAIAALGATNRFLAGSAATKVQNAILAATAQLPGPERLLAESDYVDALTRGSAPIWTTDFKLLGTAYRALRRTLSRTLWRPGGSWHSSFHEVRRGDSLARIANNVEKQLGIPMSAGLLQRINGIADPRRMRFGTKLRVPTDPIRVVVDKSSYSMKVWLGEALVRLYQVGLGQDDCTPEVVFTVVEKDEKPNWVDPRSGKLIRYGDPANPLGDYFVKLAHDEQHGFGIHGTKDQASIGKDSSMGCIRMRTADMAAVFDFLPRRTKVVVRR